MGMDLFYSKFGFISIFLSMLLVINLIDKINLFYELHDLGNPEFQYRIHKGSPIIPTLSRIKKIPRIDSYFCKAHSNSPPFYA